MQGLRIILEFLKTFFITVFFTVGVLASTASFARDQNQSIDVNVSSEQREDFAKLLDPINPVEASRMRRLGVSSADTLSSMTAFYAAMAISSLGKCYQTKDPLYCKAYVESLKDWRGQAGFGVFMASSHYTSKFAGKLLGNSATAQMNSGFLGLAAGSLANSVFNDISQMPESEALLHVYQIKNKEERDRKATQLIHAIWSKTAGNQAWWKDKAPEVTSLLGSAVASQATNAAIQSGVGKLADQLSTSPGLKCNFAKILRKIVLGKELSGIPKYAYKIRSEFTQLRIFMAYQNVLQPLADQAWNKTVIDPQLQRSRRALFADETRKGSGARENFVNDLNWNTNLWERSRLEKLKPALEIMNLHAKDLESLDAAFDKPKDVYNALMNNDIDSLQDARRYLRGFFFGPEPKNAFVESKDFHGVPDPTQFNFKVSPYRVSHDLPDSEKNETDAELLQHLKEKDYSLDALKAYGDFRAASQDARSSRLDFYENRQQKDLLNTLSNPQGTGVLDSMNAELSDLQKLEQAVSDTDKPFVEEKIKQVKQEKASAEALMNYFKTPQASRNRPDYHLNDSLKESDASSNPDWLNAVNLYNALILK